MRAELKQRWIEALRSDRYHQFRGHLRYDTPATTFHCAIGVLYDLIATSQQWQRLCQLDTGGGFRRYFAYLPIESFDETRLSPSYERHIADLNDHGFTFAQIAAVIERDIKAEPDLSQYVTHELARIRGLPRNHLSFQSRTPHNDTGAEPASKTQVRTRLPEVLTCGALV